MRRGRRHRRAAAAAPAPPRGRARRHGPGRAPAPTPRTAAASRCSRSPRRTVCELGAPDAAGARRRRRPDRRTVAPLAALPRHGRGHRGGRRERAGRGRDHRRARREHAASRCRSTGRSTSLDRAGRLAGLTRERSLFSPLANRNGSYGAASNGGSSPAIWAATSCAVPAPRITPSDPWPVATCRPVADRADEGALVGAQRPDAPPRGEHLGLGHRRARARSRPRASGARRRPPRGSGVSQICRVEPIRHAAVAMGVEIVPDALRGPLRQRPPRPWESRRGVPGGAPRGPRPPHECRDAARVASRRGRATHARPRRAGARPTGSSSFDDHGPPATIVVRPRSRRRRSRPRRRGRRGSRAPARGVVTDLGAPVAARRGPARP